MSGSSRFSAVHFLKKMRMLLVSALYGCLHLQPTRGILNLRHLLLNNPHSSTCTEQKQRPFLATEAHGCYSHRPEASKCVVSPSLTWVASTSPTSVSTWLYLTLYILLYSFIKGNRPAKYLQMHLYSPSNALIGQTSLIIFDTIDNHELVWCAMMFSVFLTPKGRTFLALHPIVSSSSGMVHRLLRSIAPWTNCLLRWRVASLPASHCSHVLLDLFACDPVPGVNGSPSCKAY